MKYINYLTFNSGDCIKNIPQGMEGEFLEIMKKIVEDAQTEKLAEVEDDQTGAVLKLEFLNEDCYIATLYNNRTDMIPMLETVATVDENMVPILNKKLRKDSKTIPAIVFVNPLFPKAPMLCDLLFKGIALNPEAAIWSGSFTNALAWTAFADKTEQKKAS